MRTTLIMAAQLLNCLLLIVAWQNLFLQTHWEDSRYVTLVTIVVGTPIFNLIALRILARREDNAPSESP